MDQDSFPEAKQDKAQRRILSMAERVDVIKMYLGMANKIRYVEELSVLFNCGRSQIRSIIKDREDIIKEWNESCKHNPYRVRRKTPPEVTALGKILSEWVLLCVRRKNKLTTALIRHAATKITKILDFPKFRPTNRWLDRFLKKYRFIDIEHNEIFDPKVFAALDVKIEDIIVDVQNKLPLEVEEQIGKLLNVSINNRYKANYSVNKTEPETTEIAIKKSRIDEITLENEVHDNIELDINEIIDFDVNMSHDDDPMLMSGPFDGWDFESNSKIDSNSESEDNLNLRALDIGDILKNTPECPIKSLEDAIKYLKPLEEYTLLTSNYRAINFVACLENLFHSQNNNGEKHNFTLGT